VKHSTRTREAGSDAGNRGEHRHRGPAQDPRVSFDLHLSSRSSLPDLTPGHIVFLDDFAYLRRSVAATFIAVLACPICGTPGLITSAQYSRGTPIVCTSRTCPGLFRIIDEIQIVSLPPS